MALFVFFLDMYNSMYIYVCSSICPLQNGFFLFAPFLGFYVLKPICRARASKMAQFALKVGDIDNNSNSPCLSNLSILIVASNKLLHYVNFFFLLISFPKRRKKENKNTYQ